MIDMASPQSDSDLMALIQSGDVRAFELFFDRHGTVAFRLAMRILNDRGLAADVTQEAFLGFWRHRDGYRPDRGAARSWLLSIVRNRAVDTWRRERNQHADLRGDASLPQQRARDDTEAQVITSDESQNIRGKLEQLPVEQRRVIELAYFGGLTHTEIAEQLGLPLGTAKGRMRLGLTKLRAVLSEEQDADQQTPTRTIDADSGDLARNV